MQKLLAEEIEYFLYTNLSDWKRDAHKILPEILQVNELLEAQDISLLINSTSLYDELHNPDADFSQTLDNHFLGYLDTECNSSQVMIDLHNIYNC